MPFNHVVFWPSEVVLCLLKSDCANRQAPNMLGPCCVWLWHARCPLHAPHETLAFLLHLRCRQGALTCTDLRMCSAFPQVAAGAAERVITEHVKGGSPAASMCCCCSQAAAWL